MSEENLEVVRRWWESFHEDGMPSLVLCDEAIEIHNPPDFPVRGSYHGHAGVRQWRDDVFDIIDDAKVAIDRLEALDDGETVLMFLRFQGRAAYTQIVVDEPWAAIWKITNGKVVHAQGYLRRSDALKAAGLPE